MTLKSCEHCAKQFEGEEKQLYCSSACKQQAYRKRKTEKEEDLFQMKFSLEEFRQLVETKTGEQLKGNFLLYCFMRKNLPQTISFKNLVFYFENNLDEFLFITSEERGTVLPAYKLFYDRYMSGEVSVVEDYPQQV